MKKGEHQNPHFPQDRDAHLVFLYYSLTFTKKLRVETLPVYKPGFFSCQACFLSL